MELQIRLFIFETFKENYYPHESEKTGLYMFVVLTGFMLQWGSYSVSQVFIMLSAMSYVQYNEKISWSVSHLTNWKSCTWYCIYQFTISEDYCHNYTKSTLSGYLKIMLKVKPIAVGK